MTFRHDELDLPRHGSVGTTPSSADGSAVEPRTSREQHEPALSLSSRMKRSLRLPPRGMVATWIVAAMVSGIVSVVLAYRVAPAAGTSPGVHVPVPAPQQALKATPTVVTPPLIPEAAASSPETTRRWDSHVAVGRSAIASPGPHFDRSVAPIGLTRTPPAGREPQPSLGLEPLRRPRGRPAPTAQISILDAPIAAPED